MLIFKKCSNFKLFNFGKGEPQNPEVGPFNLASLVRSYIPKLIVSLSVCFDLEDFS
jgi:hypothetical protein